MEEISKSLKIVIKNQNKLQKSQNDLKSDNKKTQKDIIDMKRTLLTTQKDVVDNKKTLRITMNNQSFNKSELLNEISKVRGDIKDVDKKVDKNGTKLDTLAESLRYLEDDSPTIEAHENLVSRVSKLETNFT